MGVSLTSGPPSSLQEFFLFFLSEWSRKIDVCCDSANGRHYISCQENLGPCACLACSSLQYIIATRRNEVLTALRF